MRKRTIKTTQRNENAPKLFFCFCRLSTCLFMRYFIQIEKKSRLIHFNCRMIISIYLLVKLFLQIINRLKVYECCFFLTRNSRLVFWHTKKTVLNSMVIRCFSRHFFLNCCRIYPSIFKDIHRWNHNSKNAKACATFIFFHVWNSNLTATKKLNTHQQRNG